jgi:hypothetical protein
MSMNRDTTIRRAGLYAALLVALALPAAACGGSSSPGAADGGSPGNSASASAVAYSACMRSHDVLNYPDPGSDGNLPRGNAQAFGVSNSQYQAAERACRHLLPNSDTTFTASLKQCLMTGDCPHAVVQQALTEGLRFARCMRNHGVPNWRPHRRFHGAPLLPGHRGGHLPRFHAFTADALQGGPLPESARRRALAAGMRCGDKRHCRSDTPAPARPARRRADARRAAGGRLRW